MRLIDADALKRRAITVRFFGKDIMMVPTAEIDNAPTIDAVEVVRCKDCKASRVYGKTTQWLACENVMEGQATDPGGYCYLAVRKEE